MATTLHLWVSSRQDYWDSFALLPLSTMWNGFSKARVVISKKRNWVSAQWKKYNILIKMIKVNIRTVFISTITVSSSEKTAILTSTSHVMDLDWIYSKIYWNHTAKVFDIDRLLLLSTAHQSKCFFFDKWMSHIQSN